MKRHNGCWAGGEGMTIGCIVLLCMGETLVKQRARVSEREAVGKRK